MKITKGRLKEIIKEEMTRVDELGPATGHEEGTDPLTALQEIGASLAEVAGGMEKAPSHSTPGEYSGFIRSISEELQAVSDELSTASNDGGDHNYPPSNVHDGFAE